MTSISTTYLCLFFPNWKIMMKSVWFNVPALLWTFYTIMIHILNNLFGKLSIICVLFNLYFFPPSTSCIVHVHVLYQIVNKEWYYYYYYYYKRIGPFLSLSLVLNFLSVFINVCYALEWVMTNTALSQPMNQGSPSMLTLYMRGICLLV